MYSRKLFALGIAIVTTTIPLSSRAASVACDPPEEAKANALKYYKQNESIIEDAKWSKSGSKGKGLIVLSDYRSAPAKMYWIDKEGECKYATEVNYGNGDGGAEPTPGCTEASHLTPAGFHITNENAGGDKYPYPEGLGMVGCQKQDSVARGIKVHASQSCDGGPHTFGCSGLSQEDFDKFKSEVGGGALVYNFFGDKKGDKCPEPTDTSAKCEPEGDGKGGSGPSAAGKAVSRLWQLPALWIVNVEAKPAPVTWVEPPIRKGAIVTVLDYDRATKLLSVELVREKGIGPNIATPQDFVAAAGLDDRKVYLRDPERLKGTQFILKSNLPLMGVNDYEKLHAANTLKKNGRKK